jgi:hypothetical protein
MDPLTGLGPNKLAHLNDCLINSSDGGLMVGNTVSVASGVSAMCCLEIADVGVQCIDLSVLSYKVVLSRGKKWAQTRKLLCSGIDLRLCVVNTSVELGNLCLTLVLPCHVQSVILSLVIMHIRRKLIQGVNNDIHRRSGIELDLDGIQERLSIGVLVDLS